MIILTAGARMPLRGNCLCPGKYFHELLRVDRGETPRGGLAAGETTKEGTERSVCLPKGSLGVGARDKRNQDRNVKGGSHGTMRWRSWSCFSIGISNVQLSFSFVLSCLDIISSIEKLFTAHTIRH